MCGFEGIFSRYFNLAYMDYSSSFLSRCRVLAELVSPARKGGSAVPVQRRAPAVVQRSPPRTLASQILLLQTYDNGSKEFGGSVN